MRAASLRPAHVVAVITSLALSAGCARIIGADEITIRGSAAAVPCESVYDCRGLADHACIGGTCRDLRNDRDGSGTCKRVLGFESLERPVEPFLFGAFTYLPAQPPEFVATRNYEYAIGEFSRKGGLRIGGEPRIPVAVACEPDRFDRNLDHLASLGITAVLAPTVDPLDLKYSFERINQDQPRMFFINPLASDPIHHSPGGQGLLWSMLGSPRDVAPVYLPLIRKVEAHVRATRGLDRPPRILLIQDSHPGMLDIATQIDRAIAADDGSYRRYTMKPIDEDSGQSYLEILLGVEEFRPEVVLGIAGDPFLDLLELIEENWSHFRGAPPSPFHVLSPHHAADPKFLELLAARPDLSQRIVGVNAEGASDTRLYDAYFRGLRAEYPSEADALAHSENFYDAAYFLLYAAAAAPEPEPLALGAAMHRLISGPGFDVGGLHIPDVLHELADPTRSISLIGTLGPPRFDAETGARIAPGSVWCAVSGAGGPEYHYDVLRLDDEGELTGDFDCFELF